MIIYAQRSEKKTFSRLVFGKFAFGDMILDKLKSLIIIIKQRYDGLKLLN
jgi:hypothetical protein